jgi:hypothetical protein
MEKTFHQKEKGKTLLEKESEATATANTKPGRRSLDSPLPRATPLRIRCAPRVERLIRKASPKSAQPY